MSEDPICGVSTLCNNNTIILDNEDNLVIIDASLKEYTSEDKEIIDELFTKKAVVRLVYISHSAPNYFSLLTPLISKRKQAFVGCHFYLAGKPSDWSSGKCEQLVKTIRGLSQTDNITFREEPGFTYRDDLFAFKVSGSGYGGMVVRAGPMTILKESL